MGSRLRLFAALAAVAATGAGCRSIRCGDECADGCSRGASLAFAKYDCSCDGACGPCCGGSECGCSTTCGGCDGAGSCGCKTSGSRPFLNRVCGCTGCGELYWSEWHNDPPRDCEPCDCFGNYTGPGGAGYYQAPYRRHHGLVEAATSSVPPLELAEVGEETDAELLR